MSARTFFSTKAKQRILILLTQTAIIESLPFINALSVNKRSDSGKHLQVLV